MRTKFIFGLLLLLTMTLMLSTCSTNDDININDNSLEIKEIKNAVQSGVWKITSYIESGVDETGSYAGYSFTFNTNGTLTATNGTNTVNGTWSITDDSKSNDDSNNSNDIDFNIFFSSPAMFNDDLTEDWEIVTHNNTKVELIHKSGGDATIDNLTFEKIS